MIENYQDPLKSITEKEYKILALLEFIEDEMWVNGMIMTIGDKEKIVNGDTYNRTFNDEIEIWKSYFNIAINDTNWKDGKHMGDCTHYPMTCFRCMCEERLNKVRKFSINYDKMIS